MHKDINLALHIILILRLPAILTSYMKGRQAGRQAASMNTKSSELLLFVIQNQSTIKKMKNEVCFQINQELGLLS